LFAELDEAIDSLAKIDRVDGDQNLHLRRDLQRKRTPPPCCRDGLRAIRPVSRRVISA
jgi:hypothetical protein